MPIVTFVSYVIVGCAIAAIFNIQRQLNRMEIEIRKIREDKDERKGND